MQHLTLQIFMEKVKSNRGRKPIQDKKKAVAIYLRSSEIEVLGGMEELRNKIYQSLNKNYANQN